MGDLEKLSRDQLRSNVVKSGLIKYKDSKKLTKQQLIDLLKDQTSKDPSLNYSNNELKNIPFKIEADLSRVFPFQKSIFSNYKEFKRGVVLQTQYENEVDTNNLDTFFTKIQNHVINDIKDSNVKINFNLAIELFKPGSDEKLNFFINTNTHSLLKEDSRIDFYVNSCIEIKNKIETQEIKGSGWSFLRPINLTMSQNKYSLFKGRSFLELPKWIADKKAIINVKNDDEKCFKWALLSALYSVDKDPQRLYHYKKYSNELDFNGIDFPVEITKIPKIEKMNNLAINVFTNDEKQIIPLYLSKQKEIPENKIIDLFLIKNKDKSHYCWIKNINRFLNNELSQNRAKFICRSCFVHFEVKEKYENHVEECSKNKPIIFQKPKKDYIQFEHIERSQKIPYVIYADFESIIKKFEMPANNPNMSWTENIGKHIASTFCAVVVDLNEEIIDIEVYRGHNAGEKFNEYIIKMCDYLINLGDKKIKPLTQKQQKEFDKSMKCSHCFKEFTKENPKVRDHDHFTGEFRQVLCNNCNLKNKKNTFIPVYFHNLKGYDSHLILESINQKIIDYSNITIIPNNSAKYISFSYKKPRKDDSKMTYEIRFLDTFGFMASSLDALSNNLTDEQFKISKQFYKNDEHFNLMKRKGAYPYSYMDSFKRYEETQLPTKDLFYNQLKDKNISDEDYDYALRIWEDFELKNLGEYTDIYVVNDVLMLVDVFETFRETCLKHYKLDPCWYYTAPGLAWDAMLKITKAKLQTIQNYDMYLFIEKGIRGGMVNAIKRYAKANNHYLEDYDSTKNSNYLMYLDANNLYGYGMIEKLPFDSLKFVDEKIENYDQLQNFIKKLNGLGKGAILEVDLEYPNELHDLHNDFPFCPQNSKINNQTTSKLMNMLFDKEKYVIHYKNLLQVLDHGLKLKKVHRILTFKEKNWMQKYIMLNTDLRKDAKNDFEKDFFKLMNNSVFGKTMENIRNRVDIRLTCDEKKALKLIKKPNFKNSIIINENLLSIEMTKTKLEFNKPIYVGFSILDLSKYLMYEFHYDIMLAKYGDKLSLCYQDTDSKIYDIETDDFYEDVKNDLEFKKYFDFSDYPKDHPLYDETNKKIIGKFKDELNGKIMEEFVGLKPKQYAFKVDGEEKKKSKGVKKSVTKTLKLDDFKKCLFENKVVRKEQNMIRSKIHQIYTIK